jgi:hypothetical protein
VESEDRRLGRLESGMWKVGTFRVVVDPCGLMQDFFSLWSDFFCAFFIAMALLFLLMSLNMSLFSFMTGFNSNWFIYEGFIKPSLFLSSATCTKVHMTVIIVMLSFPSR